MNFNFNFLNPNTSKGEFVVYTNRKTGKIDIITYEVKKNVEMILKEKGKWKTIPELRKKFIYAREVGDGELKKILRRAQNVEHIKTASSPTTIRLNFKV